jgi:hypothetical protein
MSNPDYPEYLHISATQLSPTERAAQLYSEGVLHPFKVEFAKSVTNPDAKLATLHKLLMRLGERPNPDRQFFKIHPEALQGLFDLIDGEVWVDPAVTAISERAWLTLMEKVGTILKQDNPKANEFQLNKQKIAVSKSLKARFGDGAEPSLEMVREVLEAMKKEITIAPNVVPV